MQFMAVRNSTTGDVVTQGSYLAQNTLDTLKNMDDIRTLPGGAANTPVIGISNCGLNGIDGEGNPGGAYNVVCAASDPLGNSGAGITAGTETKSRLITVTVSWIRGGGGRGGAGNVSMSAMTLGKGV